MTGEHRVCKLYERGKKDLREYLRIELLLMLLRLLLLMLILNRTYHTVAFVYPVPISSVYPFSVPAPGSLIEHRFWRFSSSFYNLLLSSYQFANKNRKCTSAVMRRSSNFSTYTTYPSKVYTCARDWFRRIFSLSDTNNTIIWRREDRIRRYKTGWYTTFIIFIITDKKYTYIAGTCCPADVYHIREVANSLRNLEWP